MRDPNKFSYHWTGHAVDIDIPYGANEGRAIAEGIRNRLGFQFDVVFEEDHIHIEYEGHRRVAPDWAQRKLPFPEEGKS